MWYLLIALSFIAFVSGWYAFRFEEYRKAGLAVSVTISIAVVGLLLHMIPLDRWSAVSPYLWGGLLVLSFWMFRTQVRRVLI